MNLHGILNEGKGQGRRRVGRGTAMAVAVGLAMMGGIATAVTASAGDDAHKVWVCKYVGTPGQDERLQTGQNPIPVSVHSIQHNQWNGVVPGWFSDRQDRSFVLAYKTDGNTSETPPPKYTGERQCPVPEGPDMGSLTLVKRVVNTGGGAASASDWTLIAAGPTPFHGKTPVSREVVAGDYVLSEDGPSGYTPSAWNCDNAELRLTSVTHPTVTVGKGDDVTCTITNTFIPPETHMGSLTLVKVVDNTGGGAASASDWTLIAAGPTPFHGKTPVSREVVAGDYVLSEDGPSGYTPSAWNCDNAELRLTSVTHPTVTVGKGDDVTCTITNTFIPPETHMANLTLVKEVVNTGGGTAVPSDWTLIADGPTDFHGYAPVTHEVAEGTYTLSESGPSGYLASDWKCRKTKESEHVSFAQAFTMESKNTVKIKHKDVTCTITNTFIPPETHMVPLTLLKSVVNTGGGTALATAWTLIAAGNTPFHGQTPVTHEVAEGTYTLSESGPGGYSASLWDCSNSEVNGTTVAIGPNDRAVTCTITNTFVPPTITRIIPDVPGISLVKSYTLPGSSDALADAGETIAYSFLVTNTGNVALSSVAVVDLMAGVTAVSCPSTTLAVAATFTCTASYIVTSANVTGADIVNEANASGQPPTGGRVQATAFVNTPTGVKPAVVAPTVITPAPELAGVVKNAPVKAAPATTTLAFTGAETVPLGLSGLLALVLGAVLTVASRRQSAKRPAAHRVRE